MDHSGAPSLRILCFGASITAGFYRFGLCHHPYALRLEERLKQAFPSTKIDLDIDALSGDTVKGGQYISRLQPRLQKHASRPYDWIIFQGGGNDLGLGRPPESIDEELKKIWQLGLDTGAKVLALTVTETGDRSAKTRARYEALNTMIMAHNGVEIHVADVCSAIPWPANEAEQRKIWDDGLHFTKHGYEMLGDAIADVICNNASKRPLPKM